MTQDEFLDRVAETLADERKNIQLDTDIETIPGWDSAGLLGLIVLFDGDLGVPVDVDRLRQCKTIRDLVSLADGKLERASL